MTRRTLARLLAAHAVLVVVLCVSVRSFFALSTIPDGPMVESWWQDAERVGRRIHDAGSASTGAPPARAFAVEERVVAEGRLFMTPFLFTLGLVPGRDGVRAELDGKVAYATVDDLQRLEAYDRAHLWAEASFGWGTHRGVVLHVLAEQLGARVSELAERGTFRRIRFAPAKVTAPVTPQENALPVAASSTTLAPPSTRPVPIERPERITASNLTRELVLDGVREAATHLARSVDDDGRFRYVVDAPSNITVPGYNWPRHSGATFFLAQAAGLLDDPFVRHASLRAAARLRDRMMRDCGDHRCISEDGGIAEIGSSALALIAFTEIARTGADGSYRQPIRELAAFLRSQQRPDGELQHQFDRVKKRPIDVQFLYFTGEATLALARAHALTQDPADLEAARRALARLAGSGWSFFGSRYYYSEEHWTCQAVAELWDRAPDHDALAFCARWHEYQRRLQQDADETPFDADGAFGFGPLVSPRVTPASSRGEAAAALLEVLLSEQRAGRARQSDVAAVDEELRRALAFVLRRQLTPGPAHLFVDPVAVRGAVPGSHVDWQLRIDYAQHAGSMMVRWLAIDAARRAP